MGTRLASALVAAGVVAGVASAAGAGEGARARGPRLVVDPLCNLSSDALLVQVAIDAEYQDTRPGMQTHSRTRMLWRFDCDRQTRRCSGVQMDLPADGSPLVHVGAFGVGNVVARLDSVSEGHAVVSFGPFRTFTVDLVGGRVDFTETATADDGAMSGHGTGLCSNAPTTGGK